MSFEGHTPGPWHVGTMNDALFVINEPPRPGPIDCHNHTLSTKVIAKPGQPHSEGFTFEEYRANARLIAAAPELLKQRDALLEALKEATELLHEVMLHEVSCGTDFEVQCWNAAKKADAAIALCEAKR